MKKINNMLTLNCILAIILLSTLSNAYSQDDNTHTIFKNPRDTTNWIALGGDI